MTDVEDDREFVALYTSQKTQKSKKWKDGRVRVRRKSAAGRVAGCLCDEVGQSLEEFTRSQDIVEGDEFEIQGYLVQVEKERARESGVRQEVRLAVTDDVVMPKRKRMRGHARPQHPRIRNTQQSFREEGMGVRRQVRGGRPEETRIRSEDLRPCQVPEGGRSREDMVELLQQSLA